MFALLRLILSEGSYRMISARVPLYSLFGSRYGLLLYKWSDYPAIRDVFVYKVYGDFKDNAVVIDIGAHIGAYTLYAARNSKLVVAIVPHPRNMRLLKFNVRINRLRNVILVPLALANFQGVAKFSLIDRYGAYGGVRLVHGGKDYFYVKVTTLDKLLRYLKIDADLIKIDVEGSELEVLKGALNTLSQSTLRLVIAAYHTITEIDEVEDFLSKRSFNTKRAIGNHLYAWK
jgi:FkbM family methyltransferase